LVISAASNLVPDGAFNITAATVPEIDPAGIGSVLALATGGLALLERRRLKVT